MIVNVKLFAAARQLAQCNTLQLDCPDGCTIADLRQAMAQQCPPLAPLLPHVRFAIQSQYANEDQPVRADDEIACIPPVSGG